MSGRSKERGTNEGPKTKPVTAFQHLEIFISNPWFPLSIALLLVVVADRMNPERSRILLVIALVALAFAVYQSSLIKKRSVGLRLIVSLIVACAIGAWMYRSFWNQEKILTPKDRIVAQRLSQIINMGTMYQMEFLKQGKSTVPSVLIETHPDLGDTNWPDPRLLDGIMGILDRQDFLADSSTSVNGRPLPLIEVFLIDYHNTGGECDRLLSEYGQQDDQLISAAEEILNSSKNCERIFGIMNSTSEFREMLRKGLTNQNSAFVRGYFLSLMHGRWVLKEFDERAARERSLLR